MVTSFAMLSLTVLLLFLVMYAADTWVRRFRKSGQETAAAPSNPLDVQPPSAK
ncbi:hypothetical protein JF544_13555 [Halobacillus kuroshimensis]|uniref:Uncharacterized protein n=1 Tax=Halobacillus kuroshimensis TaxID=302481 RepID=A0ABS3DY51_9BACI|nr:hypothetical protein [Halobacillus kuroshimensis]MBN8236287.1 hypothetical protein [Halobacillus kuroshimensis]